MQMADVDDGNCDGSNATESVGKPTRETTSEPIPMCNLFNNPSNENDQLATDQLSNLQPATGQLPNSTQLATPTPDLLGGPTEHHEPTLCDIFKTNTTSSSADDIFSHLTDNPKQNPLINQVPNQIDDSNASTATMESLRLNRSVDSFIIDDLTEKEKNEIDPLMTNPTPQNKSDESEGETESEKTEKTLLSSPSFVSITSFSISPDENNEQPITDLVDEESTRLEKLTLNDPLGVSGVNDEDVVEKEVMNVDQSSVEEESIEPNLTETNFLKSEEKIPYEEKNVNVKFEIADNDITLDSSLKAKNKEPETLENPTSVSLFPSETNKSGLFPSPDKHSVFSDQVEDPFAAALSSSEFDRRRDAWIPSQRTKSILSAVMSNKKSIKLEIENLTRPGLSSSELLDDPIKELVTRITGSETIIKRGNLTVQDVPRSKEGIKQLVDTGNLRAAVNLCSTLLENHGQGFGRATQVTTNTPETLQLWFIRIFLLTQLKLLDAAAKEISAFQNLDNADLYYEFYPEVYPGRRGSMVSFSFRLLYAEFPRYVEKPQESLRRLHEMLYICKKILQNLKEGKTEIGEPTELNTTDKEASVKYWTERKVKILFSIGNTLMQLKDFGLAIDVYNRILKIHPDKAVELQSGIGRIYLHMGDIRAAQQRFTEAEKVGLNDEQYKVQLILNRGFMYIGTNNWQDAHAQFESALNLEPNNIVALNNKAVCLLYLGKLKEAITVLENGACEQNTLEKNRGNDYCWSQTMTQGLILNLITLYELESSRYVVKKRSLFLKHIAPSCGDSFDTTCLKEI